MADPVGFDWFDPGKTMDLIEERQKLYESQDKAAAPPSATPAVADPAQLPDLSEHTQRWFDMLPKTIRPNVMRCSFPHILDALAKAWSDPWRLNDELKALLLIDRGSRQGFPFTVIQELHCVRDYYFDEFNPDAARLLGNKSHLHDRSR